MVTLEEQILRHSTETPEKAAVITLSGTVTYKALWDMGCSAAGYLRKSMTDSTSMIVVRAEHTAQYIALAIGCHLSGCVFVPVENELTDSKLLSICEQVNAGLVIGYEAPGFNCVSMDAFWTAAKMPFSDYKLPDEDGMADILFTTGTTGNSKGVIISHQSISAVSENIVDAIGLNSESRYLIPMPVNHAFGLRRTYSTLFAGGTVVYCNGVFPPAAFFGLLEKTGAEHIMLVPSALALILKIGAKHLAEFRDQIISLEVSSAPLSPTTRREFMALMPKTHFWNTYGATEFPGACSYDYLENGELSDCIGYATKNSVIEILDENGDVMAESSRANPGLIAVRGPMNMSGYWRSPDATRGVMRDGRVMSKDLGFRGDDGRYYVIGRADDVINIGGFKVSPVEIEDILNKYPGIKDCACVAVNEDLIGKSICLYIVLADPENWDEYAFSAFMRKHLEAQQTPKYIVPINEIPRTYNGKIQRNLLREMKEAKQ
ncbi:MAG: acyl--CoA ligase [Clostridia bacterium]|nr:acyl--CoA ligase [Clostridia bacterium]